MRKRVCKWSPDTGVRKPRYFVILELCLPLAGKAISRFVPQEDPRHIPEYSDGARQFSAVMPPEYPLHFPAKTACHIKGRGGGAFFHKTANLKILMIIKQISEPVKETRIAMEGKDNQFITCKKGIECHFTQPMRMLILCL